MQQPLKRFSVGNIAPSSTSPSSEKGINSENPEKLFHFYDHVVTACEDSFKSFWHHLPSIVNAMSLLFGSSLTSISALPTVNRYSGGCWTPDRLWDVSFSSFLRDSTVHISPCQHRLQKNQHLTASTPIAKSPWEHFIKTLNVFRQYFEQRRRSSR